MPRLILASASPRRAALLREAGYEFVVHAPDVDEEEHLDKHLPAEVAALLATIKAQQIAAQFPDDVTLAADTVVALGDMALGKPEDEYDAREMILLLCGVTHIVITGVIVRCPTQQIDLGQTVMSAVRMNNLSREELDQYIASGRWKGKAGGYGIQDPNPIVTCIAGSISNVVGLPMSQARRLLEQAGIFSAAQRSDNKETGHIAGPSV